MNLYECWLYLLFNNNGLHIQSTCLKITQGAIGKIGARVRRWLTEQSAIVVQQILQIHVIDVTIAGNAVHLYSSFIVWSIMYRRAQTIDGLTQYFIIRKINIRIE